MRKYIKPLITLSYDAIMAAIAFLLAIWLRYDFNMPENLNYTWHAVVYAALCFNIFYLANMHRTIWHYTTTRDLIKLGAVISLCVLIGGTMLAILTRLENFPRSALILTPMLHMAFCVAPRFLLRTLRDRPFKHGLPSLQKNVDTVLVIGLNDTADLFVREALRGNPSRFNIVGILDNKAEQKGRIFHNIPVLDTPENLIAVLEKLGQHSLHVTTLVLTEQKTAPYKHLIDQATLLGLKVKRVPSISNLKEGDTLTDLTPVLIEDLLGRDAVDLDLSTVDTMVKNETVMVTGAGGSIGSELCRQILARQPKHLICLEHSEDALYAIHMELIKKYPTTPITPILADVKNADDVKNILTTYAISSIFHAAAYKHVPMVECNAIAGLENNFIGTAVLTDAAIAAGVHRMVIISTDKAVNPTNIMGASKRASEIYALWRGKSAESSTKIMAVRFGNVLGSSGSVIPLFKRQLLEGGPLTVTHKDVTRYFMTIPEAVQLVLKASSQGSAADLFMLDMGNPIKVWDLAEQMIRLSGLTPHKDIDIIEIGLRPGEKLFEELSYNAESMEKTSSEKIFRVTKTAPTEGIYEKYMSLCNACTKGNAEDAVKALMRLVPEYTPAENSPYAVKYAAPKEINTKENTELTTETNMEKSDDNEDRT